jgi:ArsR family metal-binding transcriptional regulator
MTCSLTIFREIMVLLRKQAELLTFYQDYMIAMNRQMAFQEMDESSEDIKSRVEERVQAFE